MVRLDAVSISTAQPSPSPQPPSPSFHLNLHGLLLDSMSTYSSSSSFLCSPLASLPAGVGVAVISTMNLRYQHSLKVYTLSWVVSVS